MKDKKKLISIIIFVLVLAIALILSFIIDESNYDNDSLNIRKEEVIKEDNLISTYKVDIKGAIKNPGVYEVNIGDRVIDVIELAGGLLKNANTNFINLSKEVTNEMTIWIYTDKEISDLKLGNTIIEYIEKECNCPSVTNSACINNGGDTKSLVNINTASLSELMTLSGIGQSKAETIISYREKQLFNTIEDIMKINGIGESSFEKIKDYITV